MALLLLVRSTNQIAPP